MNDEKKILLDVEVKASESLKELAKLKFEIEQLKSSQKSLDTSTNEGRLAFEAHGQQVKILNKDYQAKQKEIQNTVKRQNEEQGSLDQLKAKLSLLTSEYNKLSAADRNAAKGAALKQTIEGLTTELTGAEKELGNFHRQVGNYELAGKSLRSELRELTMQRCI